MKRLRWRPNAVGSALLAVAVGAALTPVLGLGTAHACVCGGGGTSAEEQRRDFDRADVIFKATVEKRVERRNIYPRREGEVMSLGPTTYYFTPITTYKGTTLTPQPVHEPGAGSSCGLGLKGRGPFLVYAFRPESKDGKKATSGKLYTGSCAGVRKIALDEEPTFGKPK